MHTQSAERRLRPRDAVTGEPSRGHLERMILGTYREMSGLSLHLSQATRLFGLRLTTCQVVLDDLVRQGVLRRATDGQYLRLEGSR
ncbi:MAG: hypothetical protein WBC51_20140 [Vicinamibacterales bacterium]|jgi:hypothetical protein